MQSYNVKPRLWACTLLVVLPITQQAHAAAFNLLEQNASGLGVAYAGSAAIADNASTIYYNPAGMTQLDGFQVSVGVDFIKPNFKFNDDGDSQLPTNLSNDPRNGSLSLGGSGGNAGTWATLPNLYLSYKPTDRLALGLGINAPFGLTTQYDDDWQGRYHSDSFKIETYNFNPSIAFKASDAFSVGVGFNIQYIKAKYKKNAVANLSETKLDELNSTLNSAGISSSLFSQDMIEGLMPGQVSPSMTSILGMLPSQLQQGTQTFLATPNYADVTSYTRVHSTGYGWNIGFLWTPSPDTRVGLSYRSRIKHKAKGTTTATIHLPSGDVVQSDRARIDVTLPDMAILSVYHRINPQWEVMGDVSWTGWSSIPDLNINNGSLGQTHLKLKFKNSWRVALGAQYEFVPHWKLKAGVAWDQSPVRKSDYLPASLPDNDRYWVALGLQYKPSDNTAIDLGYAHLFLRKHHVDNTNDDIANYGRLSGEYKASGDIIGLNISHRF